MITTLLPPSRFVALFPHDDFLRPIRAYRSHLFSAGHIGAFSFPACILLGSAKEALERHQLSSLAVHLRQHVENASGHFNLSTPGAPKRLENPAFSYIPMPLNPTIHQLPTEIPLDIFLEPDFILCLTDSPCSEMRVGPGIQVDLALGGATFQPHFRAAFVANLLVWPANHGEAGLSFCWERGNPVWLPAPQRRKIPK